LGVVASDGYQEFDLYSSQLLGYCLWWVKEKGWGGAEKFVLGTYCYGVGAWRYKLDLLFVGILSELVFMLSGMRFSVWSSALRFASCTSVLYFTAL
jgi:hypothetical protein